MKLKTITLLAAIMQLVTLCCGVFSFVRYMQKLKWADNPDWFVTQPLYLIAHVTMVVFLFVLFARQKAS
jgi:amino acid transporter